MGRPTPTAQQRALVALWRDSSLSMSAFARAHGVLPGTFASWVARHARQAEPPPPSSAFVRVTVAPAEEPAQRFVVRVAEHTLGFDAPPPPAWFVTVLRELALC